MASRTRDPALGRIAPALKTGTERLHLAGSDVGVDLLEFWRWSASDLLSNAARGVLAEFIVARALGVELSVARDEWAAYDLLMPDGVRVEVKCSAYLQSWAQKRLTTPTFSIKPSPRWDPERGEYVGEPGRQSDVYVFALHAHKDKPTVDSLDLSQWEFYVVGTGVLNAQFSDRSVIRLSAIKDLGARPVSYEALLPTVAESVRLGDGPRA